VRIRVTRRASVVRGAHQHIRAAELRRVRARRPVARGTGYAGVLAVEGKSRRGVASHGDGRHLESDEVVADVAIGLGSGECPLTGVRVDVAARARRELWTPSIGSPGHVTGGALDLAVRALQRVTGLLVVERSGRDGRKSRRGVTRRALGTESPRMHVFVTFAALGMRDRLEHGLGASSGAVARIAFHGGVLTRERKRGFGMVEHRDVLPSHRRVTVRAVGSEDTLVRVHVAT